MKFNLLSTSQAQKLLSEVIIDIKKIDINPQNTVVININTVNGFFVNGAMHSPNLEKIIPKIQKVNELFKMSEKLFIRDNHIRTSSEFSAYPSHCINDDECSIIDELSSYATEDNVINKNSTNAFLAPDYVKWLSNKIDNIRTVIITGAMSDIDIMQFALTQKAYFNEINHSDTRIAVVENACQTYDSPKHKSDDMHSFAIYNMYQNGIIPVKI